MNRLLQVVARQVIFPITVNLGLEKVLWPHGNKVLVLMYHGVNSTGDTSINGRHISSIRFEQHLRYLKKNFEVISLSDAQNAIGTKASGKPRVVITFDDGFKNNLLFAAPLLTKYELSATFFISSVCISGETDILWPDVVDLVCHGRSEVSVAGISFTKSSKGMFSSELQTTLQNHIKAQDCVERDNLITELGERYLISKLKAEHSSENWQLMTKDDVLQLSLTKGVEIASHAHNHYNLANLSHANVVNELTLSKKLLQDCINKEIRSIAFPDGSYNSTVKEDAYKAGYRLLCAVSFKLDSDDTDPNILKRSAVSSTTNYYSNVIHFHKHFRDHGN